MDKIVYTSLNKTNIKYKIKRLFWKIGYDISRFSPEHHYLARRKKLLESYEIDIVLDVGANIGQYAKQMRNDVRFSGKIVSFEPLSAAFKLLETSASGDSKWEVMHCALGDKEVQQEINISKGTNSTASSFLNMLPSFLYVAPDAKYIGGEVTTIKTLDSIFDSICKKENNIYLKIDTQGFEEKVIQGAEESLKHIDTVQLEMSLIPLYQNELLINEMYSLLNEKGYSLVSIEPGFHDKNTGELLQVDGVFHRL